MEIWKTIEWYENYMVSNYGRIKSLSRFNSRTERILKLCKNKYWYLVCSLWTKQFRVHRLVASTFLWLDLNYTWNNLVCHKDDNKTNNHINNLFIWTHKDNAQDCVNKWRHSNQWKLWRLNSKSKKVNQYDLMWNFIQTFNSLLEAERVTWAFASNIWKCCRWDAKYAKWYKWQYCN